MKKTESQIQFPSVELLRRELRREKYKQIYKRILKSTIYTLIVVAAIAAIIATLVLPVIQIAGKSMEPSLNEGDIVVLVKTKHLKRGDLCAFSYSNKILIKRVIGLPGDYIVIDREGIVFVNGEQLQEDYILEKSLGECDIEFPYQVPEEKYFLMGDERATSIDSRNTIIGCISNDQIVGKLFLKVWPLEDFSTIN